MSELDKIEPVANCDRFQSLKHSSSLPFAFTEQGVSSLSSVLTSKIAVQVHINIMRAFVKMRQFLSQNADMLKRLELGKKWFVFSLLEVESFGLMGRVKEVVAND